MHDKRSPFYETFGLEPIVDFPPARMRATSYRHVDIADLDLESIESLARQWLLYMSGEQKILVGRDRYGTPAFAERGELMRQLNQLHNALVFMRESVNPENGYFDVRIRVPIIRHIGTPK